MNSPFPLFATTICRCLCLLVIGPAACSLLHAQHFEKIAYQNQVHPFLKVGLWAWPLPVDYDQDGDLDLLVSCPDKPYNGIYFFENKQGNVEMPLFEAGVRLGPAIKNVQLSFVSDTPRLLSPGMEYTLWKEQPLSNPLPIALQTDFSALHQRIRANQWKYVDYDGDGDSDLIVGIGDWTDYGWDNAYNEQGLWTRGPLHGVVYLSINSGTPEQPHYEPAKKLTAGATPIEVYGMPSPNFADFDGDGDLDLLCGEFLDGFTYFENTGSRTVPHYAQGRRLTNEQGPLRMDLQMITPVAIDWTRDGFPDLIVGDEDGRVALLTHSGKVHQGMPIFHSPRYFRQQAADLAFGALVTPVSVDWDADGDEDLICGNTAGYIGLIENLDGGNPPKWAEPVYLLADGRPIRPMAGPNGSIQGPCEAKWGYTTLSVADWNHDGLYDLVVNSIWGKVVWYQNVGTPTRPILTASRPVEVAWPGLPPRPAWNWWHPQGNELVSQWRTTPYAIDWDQDGLNDLVMLDHEGYLVFYRRIKQNGRLILLPPQRIFYSLEGLSYDSRHRPGEQAPNAWLRLNYRPAGGSGRRKFCFTDWDGDGRLDLMVNSVNVHFLRNVRQEDGKVFFQDMGKVDEMVLAGHTTSPTTVDWDHNGQPDLLVGAEDGRFYFLKNPHPK
ncbi:MAG: VCBS repeat-containing protein [Bacteroidetes bacterium]|nr:MAG: VCBS repeat-containing protein [Bacteroidota bacterium]